MSWADENYIEPPEWAKQEALKEKRMNEEKIKEDAERIATAMSDHLEGDWNSTGIDIAD